MKTIKTIKGLTVDDTVISFNDFEKQLLARLYEKWKNEPNKHKHLIKINHEIANAFREVCEPDDIKFIFSEGCNIIGGKINEEVFHYKKEIQLQYLTDFFPKCRHALHHGHTVPLGFYNEYDLYIAFQKAFSPTLIARYGSNGGDYASCNPHLMKRVYDNVFIEALDRSKQVGYFTYIQ